MFILVQILDYTIANELSWRPPTLLKGLIRWKKLCKSPKRQVSRAMEKWNLIIYCWPPCERPLCVGPLNFWEFGKFSWNFIWSCLYISPCCVVTCNAASVLFSPTLYSGKLACILSCSAGFDVITYAFVKNFSLLCLPDVLETWIFFSPDETLEQGQNASR